LNTRIGPLLECSGGLASFSALAMWLRAAKWYLNHFAKHLQVYLQVHLASRLGKTWQVLASTLQHFAKELASIWPDL